MRHSRFTVSFLSLGWLFICIATPDIVRAQVPMGCVNALLTSSAGLPHPYKPRAGYCDGTVTVPHRADLPLVSLTIGTIAFDPPTRLLVSLVGAGERTAWLRGSHVDAGSSYRLDGTVGPNGLNIDLSPAAIPNRITAGTLGLRAWLNRPEGPLYLPILAGGDPSADVILTFRIDEAAVRIVQWICENGLCGPRTLVLKNAPEGTLAQVVAPRTGVVRQLQIKVLALHAGNRQSQQIVDLLVPAR